VPLTPAVSDDITDAAACCLPGCDDSDSSSEQGSRDSSRRSSDSDSDASECQGAATIVCDAAYAPLLAAIKLGDAAARAAANPHNSVGRALILRYAGSAAGMTDACGTPLPFAAAPEGCRPGDIGVYRVCVQEGQLQARCIKVVCAPKPAAGGVCITRAHDVQLVVAAVLLEAGAGPRMHCCCC
jgi:hypothetical protein